MGLLQWQAFAQRCAVVALFEHVSKDRLTEVKSYKRFREARHDDSAPCENIS